MRICIFGGTFDPVHIGHVGIGIQAIKELNLDKLIIVPSKLQPFKLDQKVASGEHRINMLKLAFDNIPQVEISLFELERNQISYTINTLREFKEKYKESEIMFLLGSDSLLKIHLWKDAEYLLQNFRLIVGERPGYKKDEIFKKIQELEKEFGTKIYSLSNEKLSISSTDIKDKIKLKKDLKDIVPTSVERYIYKNALYQ